MHIFPLVLLVDSWKSILSFLHSPSAQNCQALNRARLWCLLLILTCANCDQLIPFPFSAKSTSHHFTRWIFRFLSIGRLSLPAGKISSQTCISKSPVKKSSVVPSNVCLGSATNHKLHESFPPLHRLYNSLVEGKKVYYYYCYYIFIYLFIHTQTLSLSLSHTHTQTENTHNSMIWWTDSGGRETSSPPHPPSQGASTIPTTYLYQARRGRPCLIYERHYLLLAGRPSPTSSILPPHSIQIFIRTQRIHKC